MPSASSLVPGARCMEVLMILLATAADIHRSIADDSDKFEPDLAVATLTLVPLILITSALSVGLLRRWSHKIERARRLPHSRMKPLHQTGLVYYAVGLGCGMCIAAILAIFSSLIELEWRTNSLDMFIFIPTSLVTAGIGIAVFGTIVRALCRNEFPEADVK